MVICIVEALEISISANLAREDRGGRHLGFENRETRGIEICHELVICQAREESKATPYETTPEHVARKLKQNSQEGVISQQ